jgi:hypothetical protein
MSLNKICTVLLVVSVACLNPVFAQSKDAPEVSHDGLVLEKGSVDLLYVLPEADFSGYNRVVILEAYIAFKKNWKRDQNRDSRMRRVSDKDVTRMIDYGKDLFEHVFAEELEKGGYEVVDGAAEDVLLVRPAIINLDITAPDTNTAGRSTTYAASAGQATVFLELFDSVTGQILARVFDRQVDRDSGMGWGMPATSVSNQQKITRAFRYWAGLLVDGLDRAKATDAE